MASASESLCLPIVLYFYIFCFIAKMMSGTETNHGEGGTGNSNQMAIAITNSDLEAVHRSTVNRSQWKPSFHELLIMVVLSLISLMVALDACIIVTSLSVSTLPPLYRISFDN
jgi:hypothetical protein